MHESIGYIEGDVQYKQQLLIPRYSYRWSTTDALNNEYSVSEVSLHSFSYLNLSAGRITDFGYEISLQWIIGVINYGKHINRWGKDIVRVEAGALFTNQHIPVPRSFLQAANGYKLDRGYLFVYCGFVTMLPYTYYKDKYAACVSP